MRIEEGSFDCAHRRFVLKIGHEPKGKRPVYWLRMTRSAAARILRPFCKENFGATRSERHRIVDRGALASLCCGRGKPRPSRSGKPKRETAAASLPAGRQAAALHMSTRRRASVADGRGAAKKLCRARCVVPLRKHRRRGTRAEAQLLFRTVFRGAALRQAQGKKPRASTQERTAGWKLSLRRSATELRRCTERARSALLAAPLQEHDRCDVNDRRVAPSAFGLTRGAERDIVSPH